VRIWWATGLPSWRPFSSFSGSGYTSTLNVGHVPRSLHVKRLSLASPSFAEIPSQATRVAAYYLLAETFYGTLWQVRHCTLMTASLRYNRCARLSILYSIVCNLVEFWNEESFTLACRRVHSSMACSVQPLLVGLRLHAQSSDTLFLQPPPCDSLIVRPTPPRLDVAFLAQFP